VVRRVALGGLVGIALGLSAGDCVLAHDAKAAGTGAVTGMVVTQTVTVNPDAAVGSTVVFPLGAHVHLTIEGAGAGEVHLHAIGLETEAIAGAALSLEFDATEVGRFPVEMHVDDPLLGQREKSILFVEVRGP